MDSTVLFFLIAIVSAIVYFSCRSKDLNQTLRRYGTTDDDIVYEEEINICEKYSNLSVEEIIFHGDIEYLEKLMLLEENCGYSSGEAEELLSLKDKEERKAKLRKVKRKITQKAQELYSDIPTDDRQPIADDVKQFVWQRDKGRCVKCSSQEKLEFDHIIPFSKGGSNTERNLQLLCERCNREKSNNI